MKSLNLTKFRVDPVAIKVFFSIVAIYLATLVSVANAAIKLNSYEPMVSPLLKSDFQSCPVPYSINYCSTQASDKCKSQSIWPQIFDKYSWQNSSSREFCPYIDETKSQSSES